MMEKSTRCFIVGSGRRYLQQVTSRGGKLVSCLWSMYKYDSLRIYDLGKARAAARLVGGSVHTFDPLNGDVF